MKIICKERLSKSQNAGSSTRGISSVSSDVDKLLGPKTFEELEVLEKQIKRKLNSNEPIDVDYWEQLLKSLQMFKAKARLRKVSQAVVNSRLQVLRKEQQDKAKHVQSQLGDLVGRLRPEADKNEPSPSLDPEPLLKLAPEDKSLNTIDERKFLQEVTQDRKRIHKLGYVPATQTIRERPTAMALPPVTSGRSTSQTPTFANHNGLSNDDSSEIANAQFQREVARGVQENEEVFTNEETVAASSRPAFQTELRKPKFFNRVQLGYEWNKYNQTHYDHDNPPPKVVQGYRFNVFYPNLVNKSKAPTYKIEREGGRKRGQTFAPAGEDDTCVIRFIAGPPYQDIAFRIVDKEWDYSAKRDRGFRSTFENVRPNTLLAAATTRLTHFKGVLSLHFQFKKVFYRK